MANVSTALTYQDYLALPNDGKRYEIHDGELSVTPAPNRDPQDVILALGATLRAHVLAGGLGKVYVAPFDVILSDTTVVQPDLIFVAADRAGIALYHGIEGAPTLAVEILSPSSIRTDRTTKHKLYARLGVPYYWIVDPKTRVIRSISRRPASTARRNASAVITSPTSRRFPD